MAWWSMDLWGLLFVFIFSGLGDILGRGNEISKNRKIGILGRIMILHVVLGLVD